MCGCDENVLPGTLGTLGNEITLQGEKWCYASTPHEDVFTDWYKHVFMFNFSNWHCFLTKVFPHLFYTSHHKGARNVCKSNRNMAVDDTEFPCHEKLSCVLIFIYFFI